MDAKPKQLGHSDQYRTNHPMTAQMHEALGEDGIKSMEDFAGCAADDLVGWSERKDGETKKFEGLFSKLEVSRIEAERMVLQARLAAGWITQEDLAREEEALEVVEGAEQDA
jgi:N utilization substance protein A